MKELSFKKKFLSFCIGFALIISVMFILTACNEKEPNIISFDIVDTNNDINYGNSLDKGEVSYGEQPVLNDFKLVLSYDDGTQKDVDIRDSNLSVQYFYTDNNQETIVIDDLTNLDIGFYQINYTYESKNTFDVFVYFTVVKGDYSGNFNITLSEASVEYGDLVPEISVFPSIGEVNIDEIKYLTEEEYEEYRYLNNDEKQEFLSQNDKNIYSQIYVDIGNYYIYTEIITDNYVNKYSEPALLTVIPASITKVENIEEKPLTSSFHYGYLYNTKIGKIKLSDVQIDTFDANIKYVDKYFNTVSGHFEWVNGDYEIDSRDNGNAYQVVFVPDSQNYQSIVYGDVVVTIYKDEILFNELYQNSIYDPDLENKTFTIFDNNNTIFRPLDYIDAYKLEGGIWKPIVTESGDVNNIIDVVEMQAGQYKYKLCLKDNVNFSWKIDDTLSTDDIELTFEIEKRSLNIDLYLEDKTLTSDGYVLLPITLDERLSNINIEVINKESSTYGCYFKGSCELVNIEGIDYVKFTPNGFYLQDGTLSNSDSNTMGRVDFELTGTPLDSNYKFDDLSLSCSVSRMKAGPEITDTIELTPGKTYRECFTFMLSEEFGTYEINQYTNITSLDEKVPESLPLSQVSLDFTSNSCLYYSGIIRFNVKIVKNDLIDDSGNYDEVYPESDGASEQPPLYIQYIGRWMEEGMQNKASSKYGANISIDYSDGSNNYKLTGTLSNQYSDTSTFNEFQTVTTLTDGTDEYVLEGTINTSDLETGYSIKKNNQEDTVLINNEIIDLVLLAIRVDFTNNVISGDSQKYYLSNDDDMIKLRIENTNSDNSTSIVYYLFDTATGELIGYKVIYETNEAISYNVQVKFN